MRLDVAAAAVPAALGPHADWLRPDWDSPATALMTTRAGGVSRDAFASLNASRSVGDDPAAVAENRRRVEAAIGAPIGWLNLVHGSAVLKLPLPESTAATRTADAAWTDRAGVACAVTAADCLPVLLSSSDGAIVGAAHAGWRGLAAGVLEALVAAMCRGSGVAAGDLRAWLGPCIGPQAYEVGADVLAAFGASATSPGTFFRPRTGSDGAPRWLADLPGLARQRLRAAGVQRISGGGWCTASDPSRFFSFRRDGVCGRMVAAIRVARR